MEEQKNINYTVPGTTTEKKATKKKIENLTTKNFHAIENAKSFLNLSTKTVHCDIYDTSWLFDEKIKLIDNIESVLKDSDINTPSTSIEKYIDLYDTLIKLNEEELQALEIQKKEIKDQEKRLNELREFQNMIEKNMKTADDVQDNNNPNIIDIQKLNTITVKKFQETRKAMQTVLTTCFDNSKIKDLIQDLTKAYFEGGDKRYIKITDPELMACIQLLEDSSIIVYHPYDKSKIRIDDFV